MSLLPEAIRLGPFTLLPEMIGWIAALLVAIFYAKWDMNRQGADGEKFTDVLSQVVVVGFIVSRLSAFLVAPQDSFRQPVLTLLSGGVPYTGAIAGVVGLLLFIYRMRQHGFALRPVLDTLARTGVLAFAAYSLIDMSVGLPTDVPWAATVAGNTYHPLNLYQALAALLIFAWAVRSLYLGESRHMMWQVLFAFSCAMLFVTFFELHLSTPMGLALSQWSWLLLAVVGYAGQWKYTN